MSAQHILLVSTIYVPLAVILWRLYMRPPDQAYYPFAALIIVAALTETFSALSLKFGGFRQNIAILNIYVLLEPLLLMLQFRAWGTFKIRLPAFAILCLLIVIVWVLDTLMFGSLDRLSLYYRISYSFLLVLLAVNHMNYCIVHETRNPLRSGSFLIGTGVLIFFTYKIMVEALFLLSDEVSNDFLSASYYIMMYINAFVNLIYALAALWIPMKVRSIRRF